MSAIGIQQAFDEQLWPQMLALMHFIKQCSWTAETGRMSPANPREKEQLAKDVWASGSPELSVNMTCYYKLY